MGSAPQYIFPGALLGSILLVAFALSLTAGISLPFSISMSSSGTTEGNQSLEESSSQGEQLPEDYEYDEPGCQVSTSFPEEVLQWCHLITKLSQENGMEPNLIAALMWQESGGNPTAYSKSGAVGLMQVMPRDGIATTFMCPNGPCFANRPTMFELQDPEFNLQYGTGLLAGLFAKYGNLRDALKYYGPMDVGYYYADKVLAIYENYSK